MKGINYFSSISVAGYGHIAPRTDEGKKGKDIKSFNLQESRIINVSSFIFTSGKITTILYAIFGIPLMLLYLTNIGGILAQSFRFVYGRFCLCGNRRKALAAVNRSRSIRMQRQRSLIASSGGGSLPSSRGRVAVTKPPTPVLKGVGPSVLNKSPVVTSVDKVDAPGATSPQISSEEAR